MGIVAQLISSNEEYKLTKKFVLSSMRILFFLLILYAQRTIYKPLVFTAGVHMGVVFILFHCWAGHLYETLDTCWSTVSETFLLANYILVFYKDVFQTDHIENLESYREVFC